MSIRKCTSCNYVFVSGGSCCGKKKQDTKCKNCDGRSKVFRLPKRRRGIVYLHIDNFIHKLFSDNIMEIMGNELVRAKEIQKLLVPFAPVTFLVDAFMTDEKEFGEMLSSIKPEVFEKLISEFASRCDIVLSPGILIENMNNDYAKPGWDFIAKQGVPWTVDINIITALYDNVL